MPRKFIAICSLFLTIFALAACAPAVLTSKTLESNLTDVSYDRIIRHTEPWAVKETADGLERFIVRHNDNNKDVIVNQFMNNKGVCEQRSKVINCRMDRRLISDDCFNSKCVRTLKEWSLFISFQDKDGPIQPKVKVDMKVSPIN